MPMLRYQPASPLAQYVECFWWSERSEPQDYCEHILPSGRAQLVFALHDRPFFYKAGDSPEWSTWSRSIVRGPQRGHYIVGPKPCGTVMGVSLRAGCAGAVLGVAASELAGQHVCLETLWGQRGEELRQRLFAADTSHIAFRIMETYLTARIRAPFLMHPAIARALASTRLPPRMSTFQRAEGCSPRHFIALFSASVGITPKHYYRVQRFNEVARCIASSTASSLAELAALVGYSDQAHLTREFREFAGVPPTRYRGHSASPLHHPIATAHRAAALR
jgi:AraC-like DNA-binding protein